MKFLVFWLGFGVVAVARSPLQLLFNFAFEQEWSLIDLCENLYHLILVGFLLLPFISLELFDSISNKCPRLLGINDCIFLDFSPNHSCVLGLSQLPLILHSLFLLLLQLLLLLLPAAKLNQSLKLLGLRNILKVLLILSPLILWVPYPLRPRLFPMFVCCFCFMWAIFKWKWLDFDRFFEVFSIFKIKMQLFMDSFKVRYSIGYFRHEGTLSKRASGSSPGSGLLLLLSFFLPFHHPLNPVR